MKTGKIGRWSDWLLRFESDEFIIIINKHTGEYVNLYRKYLKVPVMLDHLKLLLDRHEYCSAE